jgi:uncharacterized protein (DUF983 family)
MGFITFIFAHIAAFVVFGFFFVGLYSTPADMAFLLAFLSIYIILAIHTLVLCVKPDCFSHRLWAVFMFGPMLMVGSLMLFGILKLALPYLQFNNYASNKKGH